MFFIAMNAYKGREYQWIDLSFDFQTVALKPITNKQCNMFLQLI